MRLGYLSKFDTNFMFYRETRQGILKNLSGYHMSV